MVAWRHVVDATIGQVHGVALLIEHVQQVVLDVAQALLRRRQPAIGDVVELHLLHERLDALLLQCLQEALVLGSAQLCLVKRVRGVAGLAVGHRALTGRDELVDHLRLAAHQPRDRGVVLGVLHVALVPDWPRE